MARVIDQPHPRLLTVPETELVSGNDAGQDDAAALRIALLWGELATKDGKGIAFAPRSNADRRLGRPLPNDSQVAGPVPTATAMASTRADCAANMPSRRSIRMWSSFSCRAMISTSAFRLIS